MDWEIRFMSKSIDNAIGIIITICVPVVICVISISFLLSPVFMNLEYNRPGFPPDNYGFTTAERLEFGNQTRRYLVSNMTLDDLRELEFENGESIYIERELEHLLDVKIVLNGLFRVFWISAGILLLAGVYSAKKDWWQQYKSSISRGGWLTTFLLGLIIVLTVVNFQSLFIYFHRIFFEGNSWLFKYSDTLIRLFPIQFWQDVFLVFGLLTLVGGILIGLLLRVEKE
jgi:integral membrane protein (TIGR01906 family)